MTSESLKDFEQRTAREAAVAASFNERVSRHLAWCMDNDVLSFDRGREILGVSTETMRGTVSEWIRLRWMKPDVREL